MLILAARNILHTKEQSDSKEELAKDTLFEIPFFHFEHRTEALYLCNC
jgi:hypothetical protein